MSDGKQVINENAVYSRQEAAAALGVSLSTLKRLIDEGHLRASRPAGVRRIFIQGSSIFEMLDRTEVERLA
ncbi:MAG TPA: helix-turn-helix domain-containing protein [Aggregatilineaceae bacterium]|jgi:excisionase family DNA binding protein|nr:helix-turn-helix domain-containing protein [Anaerolineae bacterium]HMM29041.1 helix-turn-helix domain-containing protein [Aggregatilineaceae bacterium]